LSFIISSLFILKMCVCKKLTGRPRISVCTACACTFSFWFQSFDSPRTENTPTTTNYAVPETTHSSTLKYDRLINHWSK